jgi:hypothetical protein
MYPAFNSHALSPLRPHTGSAGLYAPGRMTALGSVFLKAGTTHHGPQVEVAGDNCHEARASSAIKLLT